MQTVPEFCSKTYETIEQFFADKPQFQPHLKAIKQEFIRISQKHSKELQAQEEAEAQE